MRRYWILFILFCLPLILEAQKMDSVYRFPIIPSTKVWDSLKTEDDRYIAMQIPDDLLKSMSTENLIRTCINYPAFGHFTAFDNPQAGISHLVKKFNGLQELLDRNDAPIKLLSVYLDMDSLTMNIQDKKVNNDFWPIRRCYFELLLAQDEIINKMDEKNLVILIKEARRKINIKIDHKQDYSIFGFQPTLLIMGKVLDKSVYSNFKKKKNGDLEMERFIKTGDMKSPSILSDLIEMTDSYIKTIK